MTLKLAFQISTIAVPSIAALGLPFVVMAALGQRVEAATIADFSPTIEARKSSRSWSGSPERTTSGSTRYTDNPTWPEGHPPNTQRSQAGGTR